ncbi:hypothetical protein EZS27_005885, partial [termite gut metagenome]
MITGCYFRWLEIGMVESVKIFLAAIIQVSHV